MEVEREPHADDLILRQDSNGRGYRGHGILSRESGTRFVRYVALCHVRVINLASRGWKEFYLSAHIYIYIYIYIYK